jgi:luciferase family oxidoreductase group 1
MTTPLPTLSILDLTPISEGSTATQTLHNSLDLAQQGDALGYHRYWLSEHHNTSMLASGAPELMVGQIAARTPRIKVGTGGIMLPNHAPLKVAENFRLLEALYPGRIDLGLGRAPGTDMRTALALRRSREALQAEDFPEQLTELQAYLDNQAIAGIQAIPLGVPAPAVWMLGSSTFGAQLAAARGLPFAFAHHIQPEPALLALQLYHQLFQPNRRNESPQAMLAISVICAETDQAANELAMSADLTLLRFHQFRGQPGPIPSVAEAKMQLYNPAEQDLIKSNRQRMFVGSPSTLKHQLSALAHSMGVKELMINTLTHAHSDRLNSYRLLAEAFALNDRMKT